MSINYRYLLSVVERYAEKNPSIVILDYGCGRGEIIKFARSKKINMYGADIFHNGPSVMQQLFKEKLMGDIIREIHDDHLQFSDKTFDLVICNQVFEHVRDLDKVLGEIHRVLKPDGTLFALFPAKDIFREGHTGIPFLHWFSKNKIRYIYALALRHFGLGKGGFSKEISPAQWVDKKLKYLDTKTFYRNANEIKILFDKYFFWNHQEEEIISFRAAHLKNSFGDFIEKMMKIPGIKQLGNFAFKRLAGYLIMASPR
jgi:ubiquinone/menaquinone biosynthesis C-methylase UbiE